MITGADDARAPVTTDDAFLGGKLMILQPKSGYRAGLDAVFLAASVRCERVRVLDIGAGVGTVGLCVAARCVDADVTLLERDPHLAALAAANIARNAVGERVRVIAAAVGATADQLAGYQLTPNSFDHVLANPPYHAEGRGNQAPDAFKAMSHAMPHNALDDWVRFMARMTRAGGTATLIHKADALPAILMAFQNRFGGIQILPLHPRDGEAACRILVQGKKGSRAPLKILSGFYLHGGGEGFTLAAQAILRQGAGLEDAIA
jgi:FkbM family methyltransferase